MSVSVWAIIIAGISVLVSIAVLVYTIYRNRKKDKNERIKQQGEWIKSLPQLNVTLGCQLNLRNGWFDDAIMYFKNIGGGTIVAMDVYFNQGEYEAHFGPYQGINKGERMQINSVKFDRPPSSKLETTPGPIVIIRIKMIDMLKQRIEAHYTWDPSSARNPVILESTTVDGVTI